MNKLTKEQLAELKNQLQDEQHRLQEKLDQNDHYGLELSMREDTGDLSAYDNHPADSGTEMFERGKDIALLEQDDLHLTRINEALQSMEDGSYGICITCKQPISAERLFALPDTHYCLDHSPRQIASERRPVEEEMLNPPFGRTSMDEQSSYNGFDGEDSWQIVERWGSSVSPAMAEDPGDNYDRLTIEAGENDGYVESIESFLATDITGSQVAVVRNREYKKYMESHEGDPLLEREMTDQEEET